MQAHTWNIEGAIERNRVLLLRVVARLFMLVGITEDEAVATLPRHLRIHVNRILRPAEAAVRRLVYVAASNLVVTVVTGAAQAHGITTGVTTSTTTGTKAKPCIVTRTVFLGINGVPHPDAFRNEPEENDETADDGPIKLRSLALQVIDPLADPTAPPRRRYARVGPRITSLWSARQRPLPEIHDPAPDDDVSALGICRRLHALKRALDDLPREARRMVRWQARRARDLEAGRFVRSSPMRPGLPPGYKKRPRHEVDELLHECHSLAVYVRNNPNSS